MRLTVLNQTAKGLPEKVGEDDDSYELRSGVFKRLGDRLSAQDALDHLSAN